MTFSKSIFCLFAGILVSTSANAATLSCHQMYGDGADVNLRIKISEEVTVKSLGIDLVKLNQAKLPFLANNDGFIDYRTFSVTGYDQSPHDVIQGYTLGAFDESVASTVGLVDNKGKNIGVLNIRPDDKLSHKTNIGVVIYGRGVTWTVCSH